VTEGEGFEAMLEHALEEWGHVQIRPDADRRIFERDGWRCAVPGCSGYRNLHAHHIDFRSHGGGDAPENLITLCAFHHQRGVHGRELSLRGRAPERLRFALGTRKGAPPLARYRSGDIRVREATA
jgi:hypothetical protein